MAITLRTTSFVNASGATVTVTTFSFGGAAQATHAVFIGHWESAAISGVSYVIDPGGANETEGQLVKRIVDTDQDHVCEIWIAGNQSWYAGSSLGTLTTVFTHSAAPGTTGDWINQSYTCSVDDLWASEEDSIIEQATGSDLGPTAIAGSTSTPAYMCLISNETATTNLTPATNFGTANPALEKLVSSKAIGLYVATTGINTTEWGSTGMVVGGGSGMAVVLDEIGFPGAQGAARPKAAPLQFPMGIGNWTMSNGILTR
jgi:hypothetical protein